MSDRNKIASALTDDELTEFVAQLLALPSGQRTLSTIQALAEKFGVGKISHESARTFKNTTFERRLAQMERRREKAQRIAQTSGDGTGRLLNDENAAIIAEQINDALNDQEEGAELDLDRLDALSLAVSRLRRGDVQREALEASLRESQAKLRAYEAREEERAKKKAEMQAQLNQAQKKGGLTKDTITEIEQSLALL